MPHCPGTHQWSEGGRCPFTVRRMTLHLSEGNICWPRWFKQSFTHGAPAKIPKLLRMFGWGKRKWGKSPESDTKPWAQFSGSLILREEPGLARSRPLNSPSQQPSPDRVFPTYILPLYPPSKHRHACLLTTGLTDDVESLASEYWGVERFKGRSSQIPTSTPHLLKLDHKFGSGIPLHQSIKQVRNHCGSLEEGSPRTSFWVAFIQRTTTTCPAKKSMWFPLGSCSQKSSVCLRSAYTSSWKCVLHVWLLFLDCNFLRAGHMPQRIFCLQCQEQYKAGKVSAKRVNNHKKCLEMKELKSCANIKNKFFKSIIISFLPKISCGAVSSRQGCATQGVQMNVYVDQSYYLFVQISPVFPLYRQLPQFPCEGI